MSEEASEIYVPDYWPSHSSWHNRSGLFGTQLKGTDPGGSNEHCFCLPVGEVCVTLVSLTLKGEETSPRRMERRKEASSLVL